MTGIQRDDHESYEFMTFYGVKTYLRYLLIAAWVCHIGTLIMLYFLRTDKRNTRKPCCRKENTRCRSCSFRFKVRQQHSLQV